MTASAEVELRERLAASLACRETLVQAQEAERKATVAFMNEARLHGWKWPDIAKALGVTDTAARLYYDRNKRKV